ncbi:NAD(P)/FAD-dependent oxidoreductase [Pseudodesulfovibrio portus]|uniref:Geranylgeranyl reductase n=1 Tax=Pseudodesulfovibrio portus TaxID=231439 RepID=A0ABM8ATW1_9BACT|nr:geranylgeranyl reductase family protein [Pseudodesulfovibrio portus]BDQ34685.1 geranylgeranyl reductase [Pseudodesulfovibrio portus]
MQKIHDAIICGGGPAGSSAALSLARRGLDVLVLDRARFPRKKLCGGLLTWKSVRLLENHFNETMDSLADAGAVNFASDRYAIRTLTDNLAEGPLPFPFHFVDRTVFDDRLLQRAVEAGAGVAQETQVVGCDPDTGTVTCADGRTFRGRYVIGADGANSRVRSSFPSVERERMHRFMAAAIEIAIPKHSFPRPVDHPELYVGFLDAGYGWVFPNRDKVVVGLCGLRSKNSRFPDLFKKFLGALKISPDAVPDWRGHPLPYGNYLHDPVFGRALLAGDAGGFVEPLFGEGIFFALCTGLYAGEAVAKGVETGTSPGPPYARRLHRHIIPELRASDRLRWALFRSMQWVGPRGLGWFATWLNTPLAEMVHGMRSYSWLRKKQWDF